MIRFQTKVKIFDVAVTTVAGLVSVGTMIYAVGHFGLSESWPELILNMFYLACLVMMGLFFFNRLKPEQFNYWCSVCIGLTILLRDILFAPPLAFYALHHVCLILSVTLLCMLTYFYSRKDWKSYTKRNLWMICVIDIVIAALYNYDIYIEPINEYTPYLLTEIWIRPTITYGLVACFVSETAERIVQNTHSTELIRTSQSWDGVELPDYPVGKPEIVGIKYEIPAGQKLSWHHHPVMNHGILVQGELTIVSLDGKEKTVHEGEAVVEMVGTIHHGENRGTKPVVLYMFYLSQEGLPLSVQHPKKIYFAGSIRGGRDDANLYKRMINYLKVDNVVLTEHVGNDNLSLEEQGRERDASIYNRDTDWLRKSDILIGECTCPSLGVGYELAYAERLGIPCHIFYNKAKTQLSAMLTGNLYFKLHPYENEDEIFEELDKILK